MLDMSPSFFDRQKPLAALEGCFASGRGEFFVLYGRRRVGKSALLRHFCRDKPHASYVSTRVREGDSLESFLEVLRAAFPEPLLETVHLPNWEVALKLVLRLCGDRRFVLIIDEFQYLCEENPALPSIFQKFWDTQGKDSRLMLILCGSHIGFMEHEVLAEHSPLFGRRTAQLRLRPLSAWDAMLFFSNAGGWARQVQNRLALYGIVGGIPAYLERIRPGQSLKENLLREVLSPSGYLFDEVNFLLRTELGQSHTYMSLLRAIAAGSTRVTEIASKAGLPATSIGRPLTVLRDMGLVRRDVPFDENHPERSKRGLYFIDDPFVNFWCRHVLPRQSLLSSGQGEVVLDRMILPDLPMYLGPIFEQVCREFVQERAASLWPGEAALRVGRLWGADFDLDLVAELTDGTIVVGECKAKSGPAGKSVLTTLRDRAHHAPKGDKGHRLLLCSLHGFTPEVQHLAEMGEVTLLSGEQIFGP